MEKTNATPFEKHLKNLILEESKFPSLAANGCFLLDHHTDSTKLPENYVASLRVHFDSLIANTPLAVEFLFHQSYPFRPPRAVFQAPIPSHSSIDPRTGALLPSRFTLFGEQWSPILAIKNSILAVAALINDGETHFPKSGSVLQV